MATQSDKPLFVLLNTNKYIILNQCSHFLCVGRLLKGETSFTVKRHGNNLYVSSPPQK